MTLWFDDLLLTVGLEPFMLKLSHNLPIRHSGHRRNPLWFIHGVKTGYLSLKDGQHNGEVVRAQLSKESLSLQREETFLVSPVEAEVNGPEIDSSKERTVCLRRQKIGGLGLSIKGGAEHNIPILVSRIFKDQTADQNGGLYVGDAILKVNGMSIERATHDEAVAALKNAGTEVVLTVRHFRAATPYLKQAAKLADAENQLEVQIEQSNSMPNHDSSWQTRNSALGQQQEANARQPKPEKRWVDLLSIPLLMARVSRYTPGTDKLRPNSFELVGMDSMSSGILLCHNAAELKDWLKCISANIATLNAQSMKISNNLLQPSDQILHMGWIGERLPTVMQMHTWKPKFLTIRGSDILLFNTPPVNTRDWVRCERTYKLYEVITRVYKTGDAVSNHHYLCTQTRSELNVWQNAIQRATQAAVSKLGTKTYGCTWRKKVVGLTFDLSTGFTLFDAQNKQAIIWRYRFSQLKGSSDDNISTVRLQFHNPNTDQVETQELECPHLRKLLHCMHAFLSTKLALVDPTFMRSTTAIPGEGPH
ncbi:gamma-2-syntrophin-like isoform X2 [Acanthaster planci]|uniref:Gamma-2-syntrophin-like isoform X2 n=1 Tax=Acanthaster planci TaxID=133434 RepID=A0A8B7XR47_ACAPL|nr:gamma-2-syntrophin-like isoform X2 [Acanthaster planci]